MFLVPHTIGINALFSGGFEGSLFASKAFDILLPPFVSYLSSLPPKLGFPPNPEVYTGTFVGEGVQVIVFAKDNVLYGRSGNRTESIDYWEPNRMQVMYRWGAFVGLGGKEANSAWFSNDSLMSFHFLYINRYTLMKVCIPVWTMSFLVR